EARSARLVAERARLETAEEVDAVVLAELHVEQHDLDRSSAGQDHLGGGRAVRLLDLVALALEADAGGAADVLLVVDEEDGRAHVFSSSASPSASGTASASGSAFASGSSAFSSGAGLTGATRVRARYVRYRPATRSAPPRMTNHLLMESPLGA